MELVRRRIRDFGPLGSVFVVLAGLGIGVLVAWLVNLDHAYGEWFLFHRGRRESVVRSIPMLFTYFSWIMFALLIAWCALVYVHGESDRPILGLLVFSLFADVIPFLYQGSLAILLLLLLFRTIRHRDFPLRLSPILIAIPLILISYLITLLKAPGMTASDFIFRLSYMAMLVVFPSIIRTRRQLRILFHYLIIGAILSSTFSYVQYVLSILLGQAVTFAPGAAGRAASPIGILPRATGLMAIPNHFSNTICPVITMLLFFATRPRRLLPASTRVLYLAIAAYLSLAVGLSFSRSGWLALGAVVLLIPVLRWPRIILPYGLFLGAAALVVWQSGFAKWLYETVKALGGGSVDFRWHMNHIGVMAWLTDPLFGRGIGTILSFFNPYNLAVHDTYLQILADMGLFGLANFLILFGILGYRSFSRLAKTRDRVDRDWLIGVIIGFAIILVQCLFTMFIWIRFLWAWIAITDTVVEVTSQPEEEPADLVFLRPPPAAAGVPAHGI